MATSFFTWLVLLLSIVSLLIAEAWAAAHKSRHLAQVITGKGQLAILNMRHLSGIVVFLLACWCYSATTGADVSLFEPAWKPEWLLPCIVFSMAAAITGYMSAGQLQPATVPLLSVQSIITGFALRIVFLILYEFFFRVVLLFTLLEKAGVQFAIVANILLYALLHSFSHRKEIIGTLPLGFLLCMVTLLNHSVWPAVFIHLSLAISYEARLLISHYSLKTDKL